MKTYEVRSDLVDPRPEDLYDFTDFEEEQCQPPKESSDVNVHLARRTSGHWITKNDDIKFRTSSKPNVTKADKKQKKKIASLSRQRNRK